ncbi:rRNA pseudouridine synthase [Candidatus Pacearchaeota archaeon]|nr:rRNA pseudouridine synthase [Candidatus Pacearchaeota archaeon]
MERLQKIIANAGYCSRRKAEELIEKRKVLLNGRISGLGDKAGEDDVIAVEGKELVRRDKKYYYILNKPKGILVTKEDPQGRKTIYDLDSMKALEKKIGLKLNYVGRLDGMSEGLLILTNDGEFNNLLTHPSHSVSKTYLVRTEPTLSEEDVLKLKNGVMIDTRKMFGEISKRVKNEFKITIGEGRNRIIRRVMESLGYTVYRLKRVSVGEVKLKGIQEGTLHEMTKEEIESLQKYSISDEFL